MSTKSSLALIELARIPQSLHVFNEMLDDKYYIEDEEGTHIEIPSKALAEKIADAIKEYDAHISSPNPLESGHKTDDVSQIKILLNRLTPKQVEELKTDLINQNETPDEKEKEYEVSGISFVEPLKEKKVVHLALDFVGEQKLNKVITFCSDCKINEATTKDGLCKKCYQRKKYLESKKKARKKKEPTAPQTGISSTTPITKEMEKTILDQI